MKRGRKINEGFYSHVGSDGEKRKDGLIEKKVGSFFTGILYGVYGIDQQFGVCF